MRIDPKVSQRIMVTVLSLATGLALVILFFIIIFILSKGIPVLNWKFLSTFPSKMGKAGGILPTIAGTFILTLVALVFAVPLGVGAAIYLAEYIREGKTTKIVRFGADCLAGIPSIIFGLFGFILFVVILKMGWSILSGGLTLAFMVLPTIIRTSEEAVKSVPYSWREVSLSLGATKWETIRKVVLPNAVPGILTGIILSVGRSIGETAAIIFTAGSSLRLPTSLFDSVRTMSVHFYILSREGISMKNAYGTAAVLVILILAINLAAYWILHRFTKRNT
ncbi:phosphate ABC transporter, permease protein PstA [Candidatus Desantisbacteria bacterium CG_4_10_14_0_8_um_filter_48_22]|uniref:Phosphate transport system permease protein PstA n=1 Tax=Candidatus Desantisbacteria bacterium CG_4_10_14_0_8_um_filter_48_22 TaxID=1974543 RepID=A0A2M7SAI2_9BACT|nr:MAG: phosphate ABC transporter, permease protein PstA [Candidatus Desantisbacteria bacterium CG1_02_49_89]PIV54946.1 MAG: phosphate ABC transporter, permease protein PstA [Candidatus Desantisbacteria bacterium CG02_land_8_20_14_3_00_49_13]PIZ16488.1 MAG: phosphate ABC transporter, permease protein PstA [Candidatus Desantisbacteria bacterium CG_4_10_14_0_8_um_filter_48_22]PJB28640.1 MAG: phosphate ABC transporter, permease protein PstA [Candidatus Desantisbacteria bacterium CG_4_9_14_3_um_filt